MLNSDPSRTDADDRWRSTFSEELPQGPWRDQFLAKANATPEGQALALSFEGRRSSSAVRTLRTGRSSGSRSESVSGSSTGS